MKDYEISPRVEGEREIPRIRQKNHRVGTVGTLGNNLLEGQMRLFVSGLSPDTDDEWLKRVLGEYGNLRSLTVAREKGRPTCKGFAYCEFDTELEMTNCINGLNNKVVGSGSPRNPRRKAVAGEARRELGGGVEHAIHSRYYNGAGARSV